MVRPSLRRQHLLEDPVRQFAHWFREACESDRPDPNAMSLATVGENRSPACRTVLLKYFDQRGYVFFTNLSSNKSRQIAANSGVALLFFWPELGRQVCIRGNARRVSARETLRYFTTRPRGSQIGAWVSSQSSIISSRSLMEAKFEEMKRKFANNEVPLPSFWGGFRVVPAEYEFWQGQADRLHDRFLYSRRDAGRWSIARLAP